MRAQHITSRLIVVENGAKSKSTISERRSDIQSM
jgi:hypothetical protein